MSEQRKIQEVIIKALEENGYEIPFWKFADSDYIGFNVVSKENENKKYLIQINK